MARRPFSAHAVYRASAALRLMRLDPNTHAYVLATAFFTSITFAIAGMAVIALVLHLTLPS